jgi:hypothetical protein
MPGFTFYKQAIENRTIYPLKAYSLFLNCHQALLGSSLLNQISQTSNKYVAETYRNISNNNLLNVTNTIDAIIPKTLASLEWLDLSKREISDARKYINQSEDNYIKNNFNQTIFYLFESDSSLYKAKDFALIANENNLKNISFIVNNSELTSALKLVSSEWFTHAESLINSYKNIGYKNRLQYASTLLNQSKEYDTIGLGYISLMTSANAQALAHYKLYENIANVNYSQTLKDCETYLNYAEITMSQVYINSFIDAPYAESNIELARQHYQDAKNEDNEINASALARLSIQESLIAHEQAQAALDLKYVLNQNIHGTQSSISPEKVLQDFTLDYILVGIIILETIFFIFFYLKKNKK